MDSKTQSKVFGAFIQADASTTREYGGTGLGLAISRKLTDIMGGQIELDSTPGSGTSFTILLPVEEASENLEVPTFPAFHAMALVSNTSTFEMVSSHFSRFGISTSVLDDSCTSENRMEPNSIIVADEELIETHSDLVEHVMLDSNVHGLLLVPLASTKPNYVPRGWLTIGKPITSSSLYEVLSRIQAGATSTGDLEVETNQEAQENEYSILVAEDVETNQKIVREILQMLGCRVQIAANGGEAVQLFSSSNFDLIFMDCQMPVLDGYEATKQIRLAERASGRSPIPIVALTAGTSSEDEARCLQAGMDHYLSKPFTVADISATLKVTLGLDYTPKPKADNELSASSVTDLQSVQLNRADVINLRAIENIREVERQTGKEILSEIFRGFVSQMKSKLEEASKAAGEKNFSDLRKIAHAMKSMSANMGADRVRLLSAALEADCDAGNSRRVSDGLSCVENAYAEFIAEFDVFQTDEDLKLR